MNSISNISIGNNIEESVSINGEKYLVSIRNKDNIDLTVSNTDNFINLEKYLLLNTKEQYINIDNKQYKLILTSINNDQNDNETNNVEEIIYTNELSPNTIK